MTAAPEVRLRILIVEDNAVIAANLHEYLEGRGHCVESAGDGARAFRQAVAGSFDAIVLDLGLPGMDGLEFCRRLRVEAAVDTPVLMVTARDTLDDKLKGFDSGTDDYVVKPFALEEIAVRLDALYRRRAGRIAGRMLRAGQLELDPVAMRASLRGIDLALPPKCMRLLSVLMSEPGRLFSRRELELELWGEEQDSSERLRHHLHLLRRQLGGTGDDDPIRTVHGQGYRLEIGP